MNVGVVSEILNYMVALHHIMTYIDHKMYVLFSDILFDVVYVFWYTCFLTNEKDPRTQKRFGFGRVK